MKIIELLIKNKDFFLLIAVIVLGILLFKQCEKTGAAKEEAVRVEQNYEALKDTLVNYKTKDGLNAASKKALRLKLSEVRDSLEFEKNKPPVTIIEYKTQIKEKIVEVPVYIQSDSLSDKLVISDSTKWEKSSRIINVIIPFKINNNSLYPAKGNINLEQKIWLSASLTQDQKTKQAYVNLKSDYPGLTFNDAQGVLIENDDEGFKSLKYKSRKTISLGLQVGYGFQLNSSKPNPYVGIGVQYSPRFLQW